MESVRERLLRATKVLGDAGVPYAVIGGNAVAAWVSTVDASWVRHTQDVDILLRREDFERAKAALEPAGFIYRHAASIDMFLDGPGARARDALHILYAGERVKREDALPAPDVDDIEDVPPFRYLSLRALLQMKLTANRRKDQVHIGDMHGCGLIDHSWLTRVPPELASRLQAILDDPDG